jgi:hypothetical protein
VGAPGHASGTASGALALGARTSASNASTPSPTMVDPLRGRQATILGRTGTPRVLLDRSSARPLSAFLAALLPGVLTATSALVPTRNTALPWSMPPSL